MYVSRTLPSLHFGTSIFGKDFWTENRMATRVDPDETARYELSHLDLHYLQRYLYRSTRYRGSV